MAVVTPAADALRAPLHAWLLARLREGGAQIAGLELSPFASPPSGQSNTTLIFLATWVQDGTPRQGEYVLRVQPSGNQLFLDPDVLDEFRVMAGLADTPVPVPAMCWMETDPAVLGAPFYLMKQVHGTVPQGKPSIHKVGWLPTLTPEVRGRVYRNGLATLAALHAVDWRAHHAFLAQPLEGLDLPAHVARFRRWYDWTTQGRPYPVTDAAMAWLEAGSTSVDAGPPVLVWGDARLGNLMYDDAGQVVAVLDWELATIAPAGVDLGHWLMLDEFHAEATGVERLPGCPDRATEIAWYEEAAGKRLPDIAYFEVRSALLMATTLIRQGDLRAARGELPANNTMGTGNPFTQILARRLGLPVPELSEAFLAHRRVPVQK